MKKLLLATLLVAGAMAPISAQELSIQYQGEDVPNGGTVVFEGYTFSTDFEGMPDGYTIWTLDPELYLVSDVVAPITVRAKANDNISIQLCAGGNCMRGNDVTKEVEKLEANVPLNLQLDYETETYEGDAVEIPAITIEVEAYYNDDPDNVYSITVKMGGFTAGVESIGNSGNTVSFSGNALHYDLPAASQLSLYSLSGKTVINKNIAGSGSLDLNGLPKGVYIYRVSGKYAKSAKIIIR